MKTLTTHKNHTFSLGAFPMLLFALFFISSYNVKAHTQEWMMQLTYGGYPEPIGADVYLYSGGQLIRSGAFISGLPWAFNPSEPDWKSNFACDVHPNSSGGQTNSTNRTWDVIYPGQYIVRIVSGTQDIYFSIYIPDVTGTADFNLKVDLYTNTITDISNGRGVSYSGISNFTEYSVTLKNSFSAAGTMKVDGTTVTIPNGGIDSTWGGIFFPHTLEAIDQQPTGISYMQRFYKWTKDGGNETYDRSKTISAATATYQAYFKSEYNVTFQNNFPGATGGVIEVSGTQNNAPFYTTALQYDGITATSITNYINGIQYDFDHWSDGSTNYYNYNTHFTPTGHTTYTAYYTAKPSNANKNQRFNDTVGTYVVVKWDDNPNTNVSYEIWRKVRHNGVTGSPSKIATLSHGTERYTDYEYKITSSYTDDIAYYDVSQVFTYGGNTTYSDPTYQSVFAQIQARPNLDIFVEKINLPVKENLIQTYPDPFNPSTTINYQLINSGHVILKVYDSLGRLINTLVDNDLPTGRYSVRFDAGNLSSGVYIYRIEANGFIKSGKMLLTK